MTFESILCILRINVMNWLNKLLLISTFYFKFLWEFTTHYLLMHYQFLLKYFFFLRDFYLNIFFQILYITSFTYNMFHPEKWNSLFLKWRNKSKVKRAFQNIFYKLSVSLTYGFWKETCFNIVPKHFHFSFLWDEF